MAYNPGLQTTQSNTLTRATTDSTGTQTITGLGNIPKHIDFWGSIDGSSGASFSKGKSDGNTHVSLEAGTITTLNTTKSIRLVDGSGNGWNAFIQSMDVDGFTLNWTKEGTGANITVKYYVV